MSNTEIFDNIYKTRAWGPWPASGGGSTKEQTSRLARKLPEITSILSAKRVIDCGCGDLNWLPDVDLSGASYVGFDVSPSVVADLKIRFPDKDLRVSDICDGKLAPADLALCRDVLVHLPFDKIWAFFRNLKRHNVKYVATTSFPSRHENADCKAGDWRPLNLEAPPFDFPLPLITVNERLAAHGQLYRDKSTCVWAVDSLPLT